MSTNHENRNDPSPEQRERYRKALSIARIEASAAAASQRRMAERCRRHADATEGTAAEAWIRMAEGEIGMAAAAEQAVSDLQELEDRLIEVGWL